MSFGKLWFACWLIILAGSIAFQGLIVAVQRLCVTHPEAGHAVGYVLFWVAATGLLGWVVACVVDSKTK